MKYEELRELLQYDDDNRYESALFMPNEIFGDLQNHINSSPHVAFSYSYIYLITWMYRYAKYGKVSETIKKEHINKILCYGAKTQELDYLIKKNGVLEQMNYIRTTGDFPLEYHYSNDFHYEMMNMDLAPDELTFTTFHDLKAKDDKGRYLDGISFKYHDRGRNYKVKYPVKAFERVLDEEGNIDMEGTFFEVDNTHLIPFEVFLFCMSNDKLGCTGFYLYAYFKHKNDLHKDGYDVSLNNLSIETKIPNSTLNRFLSLLKSYKMIQFHHNQEIFSLGYRVEDRKANTYITNDYFSFSDKPVPYEKIKIVPKYEYLKQLKEEEESNKIIWGANPKVDISLDDLPY